MADISIVINADTRPGYLVDEAFCGMFTGGGARSIDFMTDNVMNKREFFRGHSIEVTLYIDVQETITDELMSELGKMVNEGTVNNLVFNRHTRLYAGKPIRQWHDILYLNALTLARGKYVAHFDADTGAYRRDECNIIDQLIEWVESGQYDFVSYPSVHSPNEGPYQLKPGEPDYLWASTRFFFCKRETLNYNKFVRCLDDQYWIGAHQGKPHRYPNVTEQILGFMAGAGRVLYPPKDLEQFMIFCWHRYFRGTIGKLNKMSYAQVYAFIINQCGGINGPCDVCQETQL